MKTRFGRIVVKKRREFAFVLDAAATEQNRKCAMCFTPETDGLTQNWDCGGAVFCNPPYGREIGKWVEKAYLEACKCKHPTPFLKGQASKIFKDVATKDKVLIVQKQNKPQNVIIFYERYKRLVDEGADI